MSSHKNLGFKNWASAPASWITTKADSQKESVLASRLRVARNLNAIPFPHNAPANLQKQVLETVSMALKSMKALKNSLFLDLNSMTTLDRNFLMERQLISHEHAFSSGAKGLVVTPGENLSIMINEEDHIRAASFKPGLSLVEAWEVLSNLDDEMEKNLPFAFDDEFGYLTAWPTNTGTGLRASCLLHLPALVLSGKMSEAIKNLDEMNVTTRGFYGEGTSAVGDLLQISNSRTLGPSESSIIQSVLKVVKSLCRLEDQAESALMSARQRQQTEDRIYRSLGTLKWARLLNYEEAMHHLSMVRLGNKLGLKIGLDNSEITNLFFLVQPAHLWIREGAKSDDPAAEALSRAAVIRSRWDKGKNP